MRIATNEGVDGAVVGGFEAAADSTYSVKLTNAQWKTDADENGIAEVRFMTIINA